MKDLRATGETRSVAVDIEESPEAVYAFISAVERMGALGPECERCEWVEPGSMFRGHNRNGDLQWTSDCYVVEAEPGRRFAYETGEERFVRWSHELEAVPTGTRLTHSFEILHLNPVFANVPDEHLPMRWQALEDGMRAVVSAVKTNVEAAREPEPV